MSELFDEIARTLARPMPRSRALRTIGGALVAVALPGVARTAPAWGGTATPSTSLGPVRASTTIGVCEKNCTHPFPVVCLCKAKTHGCFETCGVPGATCCCQKGSDGSNAGVVACPPGTRCGKPGESNCPCVNNCGGACCGPDQYCANRVRGLCCKTEETGCGTQCCNKNEECRTIRVGTGSTSVCEKRCPPAQAWCGRDKCCPPKWHCVNRNTGLCKRCGRNEEECGKKCCNKRTSRCCGEGICCQKGRACCTVDDQRVCCPPRTKCALQLLGSQSGLTKGSPRVCCPIERFSTDPELCCPPGQVPLNSPGLAIPPPGVNNPFCCPRQMICTSTQTGNNICVDRQTDPRNCGSCGNQCSSGICRGGVCQTV